MTCGTRTQLVNCSVRILPVEEWDKIGPIYTENGGNLPKPDEQIIAVVEMDGKIIGLCAFNLVPHVGPIWVHEDYRRLGFATELIKILEKHTNSPGYFMFPSNEKSIQLCAKLGMTQMEWEVWKKEI